MNLQVHARQTRRERPLDTVHRADDWLEVTWVEVR
jgi:hypothetical protein